MEGEHSRNSTEPSSSDSGDDSTLLRQKASSQPVNSRLVDLVESGRRYQINEAIEFIEETRFEERLLGLANKYLSPDEPDSEKHVNLLIFLVKVTQAAIHCHKARRFNLSSLVKMNGSDVSMIEIVLKCLVKCHPLIGTGYLINDHQSQGHMRQVSLYKYALPVVTGFMINLNSESVLHVEPFLIRNLLESDGLRICYAHDILRTLCLMSSAFAGRYTLSLIGGLSRLLPQLSSEQRCVVNASLKRFVDTTRPEQFEQVLDALNPIKNGCCWIFQNKLVKEEVKYAKLIELYQEIHESMTTDRLEAAAYILSNFTPNPQEEQFATKLVHLILYHLLVPDVYIKLDAEQVAQFQSACLLVAKFITLIQLKKLLTQTWSIGKVLFCLRLLNAKAEVLSQDPRYQEEILVLAFQLMEQSFENGNFDLVSEWIKFAQTFTTFTNREDLIMNYFSYFAQNFDYPRKLFLQFMKKKETKGLTVKEIYVREMAVKTALTLKEQEEETHEFLNKCASVAEKTKALALRVQEDIIFSMNIAPIGDINQKRSSSQAHDTETCADTKRAKRNENTFKNASPCPSPMNSVSSDTTEIMTSLSQGDGESHLTASTQATMERITKDLNLLIENRALIEMIDYTRLRDAVRELGVNSNFSES